MKSGDWRQIEEIFQEALQHDPANCLPCRRVFGASLSTDLLPMMSLRDGQHFIPSDMAASLEPLTVIVNWLGLLKNGAAP
jgi:hypothetical protein